MPTVLMTDPSTYQVVLIVILVLNFTIWFLVICCRFCSFAKQNGEHNRRQRARVRVGTRLRNGNARRTRLSRRNDSINGFENRVFSIQDEALGATGSRRPSDDMPPSYEEATKYVARPLENVTQFPPQRNPYLNLIHVQRQRQFYEHPVVLSVPEEPTSTSETRLLSTLTTETRNEPRLSSTDPTTVEQSSVNISDRLSELPNSDSLNINSDSITFVVNEIGSQAARVLPVSNTSTEFTDSLVLQTHSEA